MTGPAEVQLKNLAQVHARRYADGIKDDVHRCAVGQERHIFRRGDDGDDALVAVAAGQLIADRYFTLLRYPYLHPAVDPGGQVVAGFAGKDLDGDDLAPFAVRHPERGILDLPRLLTENGPQQFFFGGEFGLALGGDLTYQDIVGAYLGADADDALFIELSERFLADVGNVAGDLFEAQLGIPGLDFMLGDMDRGEPVGLDQPVADDNSIFVVVAMPAHEGADNVLAEG